MQAIQCDEIVCIQQGRYLSSPGEQLQIINVSLVYNLQGTEEQTKKENVGKTVTLTSAVLRAYMTSESTYTQLKEEKGKR